MTQKSRTAPRLRTALSVSVAAQGVSVLGSLLTVPLFLRAFGAIEFGFWSSLLGLTTYLSLLNLGIAQTVASRASTRSSQPHEVWASVRRGLVQYSKVFVVAAPCVLASGFLVPWVRVFRLPESSAESARWAAIAVGLTFLFELPASVFRAALQGSGAVAHERAITISSTVVRVGVAWILALTHPPLWMGVIALSALNVLASIGCYLALKALVPGSLSGRVGSDEAPARADDFNSSGFHFLLLQIGGAVIWGSDVLIVGLMKGPTEAAQVAVAVRLVTFGTMIGSLVVPALGPFLAIAWAQGDRERARRLSLESGQVMTAAGIVTALGFGFAGAAFMRVWVGPQHFVGYPTWLAYCATIAIQGPLMIPHAFLTQTGTHRRYARWTVAEAFLKAGLSIGFIPYVGILSIPAGTFLAHVSTCAWVLVREFAREIGERPWAWAWRAVGASVLPTLAFLGVYAPVAWALSSFKDFNHMIGAVAGGLTFVLVFLFKGAEPEVRKRLLGMSRSV